MQEVAIQAAELTAYEWKLIGGFACLSAFAAMALAGRDRQYRDFPHLAFIGAVGGVVGAGVVGGIGHASGGLVGNELLLFLVASGSGLGGRKIEQAITKRTASALGINPMDLDSVGGGDGGPTSGPGEQPETRDSADGTRAPGELDAEA